MCSRALTSLTLRQLGGSNVRLSLNGPSSLMKLSMNHPLQRQLAPWVRLVLGLSHCSRTRLTRNLRTKS